MPSRHTTMEQPDRLATHSPAPPNLTQPLHAHARSLPTRLATRARTQRPPHARPHHSQPRHTSSHTLRTRPARPPPPSDAPLRPPARRRQPCALRDGSRVKGLPDTARRGKRILLAPAVAGAQPAGATLTRTASPNPTCGHGPARPWPGRDRSLRRCPLTALLTLLC